MRQPLKRRTPRLFVKWYPDVAQTLERLIGCNSLFTALDRQVAIRHVDAIGLLIIFTWALSPLGGQSSLRLLSREPHLYRSRTAIRYLPLELLQWHGSLNWMPEEKDWIVFSSTYISALGSSRGRLHATQDPWNSIRIPTLDNVSLDGPSDEWQPIDYSRNVSYASLLGLPFVGIDQGRNFSFQVGSRYWKVNCLAMSWFEGPADWSNVSLGLVPNDTWIKWPSTFKMEIAEKYRWSAAAPNLQHFTFTSRSGDDGQIVLIESTGMSSTECVAKAQGIECSVECLGVDCRVVAIRPTVLSEGLGAIPSLEYALLALSWTSVSPIWQHTSGIEVSSPTERWLMDPDSSSLYASNGLVNLSEVPLDVFNGRLSVVLNTFWDASFASDYRLGGIPQNTDFYDNPPYPGVSERIPWNTTEAQVAEITGDIYICNYAFAGILLVISVGLFLATITTAVVNTWLLAPDVLGYVSSLTRDNPYVSVQGASHLDSLARARALRDVRIMIGDVDANAEIGHIAITEARESGQLLRRGRLYD